MLQASGTFQTFSAPSYQKWAFWHSTPTDLPTSASHCRPGSFQVNKKWAEKTRLTRPDKKQEIGYNKKEHSGKSTAKLAPPAVSLAWMFFSFWLREPDLNWRPSGYERFISYFWYILDILKSYDNGDIALFFYFDVRQLMHCVQYIGVSFGVKIK